MVDIIDVVTHDDKTKQIRARVDKDLWNTFVSMVKLKGLNIEDELTNSIKLWIEKMSKNI